MAETRLSVHVCNMQCQKVCFLSNAWKYRVVRHIYSYNDSEFQTEGALTLNAFADNASAIGHPE